MNSSPKLPNGVKHDNAVKELNNQIGRLTNTINRRYTELEKNKELLKQISRKNQNKIQTEEKKKLKGKISLQQSRINQLSKQEEMLHSMSHKLFLNRHKKYTNKRTK